MSAVEVATVSRVMEELLVRDGRAIICRDRATGEDLSVPPMIAASPTGLLPALVVAGEAVWREATGKGFALDVVRDPEALFGYRLRGIGAGTFATVMLSIMEASAQASRPGVIAVNALNALWSAATDRRIQVERSASPSAATGPGAGP
ncbi:MAG: hypothetical protein J0H14_06995 [Alphaproteobacteria bacterium]|nr:hypothetical protein [Alphaproteobacteria bacterium]